MLEILRQHFVVLKANTQYIDYFETHIEHYYLDKQPSEVVPVLSKILNAEFKHNGFSLWSTEDHVGIVLWDVSEGQNARDLNTPKDSRTLVVLHERMFKSKNSSRIPR
jgi:hypothetical protein